MTRGASEQPASLLTAQAIVAALVGHGVRHVVLCPGSRNAPLGYALAAAERAGQLQLRVVVDERSAGFIALGVARAALAVGRCEVAAVVTTSGSAVAHLLPAVTEADTAGIPLLVVSADRPAEMVGVGANQTTTQAQFAPTLWRASADLPADLPLCLGRGPATRAITAHVGRLVSSATGAATSDRGPAQLNVRLRPPLAPKDDADLTAWEPLTSQHTRLPQTQPRAGVNPPETMLGAGEGAAMRGTTSQAEQTTPPQGTGLRRGLIIAGDAADQRLGAVARELSQRLNWPLFAEPSAGARAGATACSHYARVLSSPAGRELSREVEGVVVVGHPTLSRPITGLLAREDCTQVVISETARVTNVAGAAALMVTVTASELEDVPATAVQLESLVEDHGLGAADDSWMRGWQDLCSAAGQETGQAPAMAREAACAVWEQALAEASQPEAPLLVIGSSMTIRYLDDAARPSVQAPLAMANRGLAGIDGTLATAVGAAWGSGRAVRAVVGDLTAIHDLMSLNRGCYESEPDVQIVVLDDAGGAIFRGLEYGRRVHATEPHMSAEPEVTAEPEPGTEPARVARQHEFARLFGTPQVADIAQVARALGARVTQVTSVEQLREVLAQPIRGTNLIHVDCRETPAGD